MQTFQILRRVGTDTESEIEDLQNMMRDKHFWLDIVNGISVGTSKLMCRSPYSIFFCPIN